MHVDQHHGLVKWRIEFATTLYKSTCNREATWDDSKVAGWTSSGLPSSL